MDKYSVETGKQIVYRGEIFIKTGNNWIIYLLFLCRTQDERSLAL